MKKYIVLTSISLVLSSSAAYADQGVYVIEENSSSVNKQENTDPLSNGNRSSGLLWSYNEEENGPDKWASIRKDFSACDGGQQSPINIRTEDVVSSVLPKVTFLYNDSSIDLLNNAYTVQQNYQLGSSIKFDGKTFNLVQYNFHSPSEHRIDGKEYPMEVHLMHESDDGQVVIIGVMFEQGKKNTGLNPVWEFMPKSYGETGKSGNKLSALDLLPINKNYYFYQGSLTTPPCSESVNWVIMQEPIEATAAQLRRFEKVIAPNARPIQKLNRRFVLGN